LPKWLLHGLAVWLIVFSFFAIPGLVIGNWILDYQLETSGVHTVAVITALQPDNHGTCSYRYDVAGRSFGGSDENCPNGRVGSRVAVTYLSSKPSISVVGDASGLLFSHVFIALAVPTMLAVGAGRWSERSTKARQPAGG
jgi:hypothetical protein